MRRRDLIILLGGVALLNAPIGRAQEPGRVYRFGILTPGATLRDSPFAMIGAAGLDAIFIARNQERDGEIDGKRPPMGSPVPGSCTAHSENRRGWGLCVRH
jgi:hypothetical protein